MKKFYCTISIPYVNAKPHIGHALEFTQGDVLARWHRKHGYDTYVISGADENSLKVVQAAEKAGVPVQQFADENAAHFHALIDMYNIALDAFQRSSSKEHHASSQALWERCNAKGDLYKKEYTGKYCVGCETFYKDEDLNEDGECGNHPGKPLDLITEENYFFRLSKYEAELKHLITENEYLITPASKRNEVLQFIEGGLEDFSVSRSKERAKGWGVEVPGDEVQIMYVWFDALNVYRSGAPEAMWPADLHIIGKDITRFHALYWPAMLMSADLPLPKELFIHGFITVDGRKMSKSIGNVVDPIELVQKYGVDPVRYYLLREIPADDDGDFSEEKFVARYNADLANGVGNLFSRITTLAEGEAFDLKDVDAEIKEKAAEITKRVDERLTRKKFHEALAALWELVKYTDEYLNAKAPWKIEDEEEKKQILGDALYLLVIIADMLEPYLPETSEKMKALLSQEGDMLSPTKPETPLFERV